MPDFTVIDGGGKSHDYDADRARDEFQTLVIELLRALARGEDYSRKVAEALFDFTKFASRTEVPVWKLIHEVILWLHEKAIAQSDDGDGHEDETRAIVEAALRVAAEGMAEDPAAKGRLSKRKTDLRISIEQ